MFRHLKMFPSLGHYKRILKMVKGKNQENHVNQDDLPCQWINDGRVI